jgi:hypothetical protein
MKSDTGISEKENNNNKYRFFAVVLPTNKF